MPCRERRQSASISGSKDRQVGKNILQIQTPKIYKTWIFPETFANSQIARQYQSIKVTHESLYTGWSLN